MTISIEHWFACGARLPLRVGGQDWRIFCRAEGEGPWLTLLHGFPTCSWDWAKLAPLLREKFNLLCFDFLGFGDSDKPSNYQYSLCEQADLVEAVWADFGIKASGVVAHDYGSTVAVELLQRQTEGKLSASIARLLLMNAGLYVDLQRPVLAQRLLQKPGTGPLLNSLISQRFFRQQFTSIFSRDYPLSDYELTQHWQGIARRDGVRNYHRLIYYLTERQMYKSRWEYALEHPSVPLRFVWGLQDPVSGAHISNHIRQRRPQADLVELPDVGHYPQLEAPERVAQTIQDFFS